VIHPNKKHPTQKTQNWGTPVTKEKKKEKKEIVKITNAKHIYKSKFIVK